MINNEERREILDDFIAINDGEPLRKTHRSKDKEEKLAGDF